MKKILIVALVGIIGIVLYLKLVPKQNPVEDKKFQPQVFSQPDFVPNTGPERVLPPVIPPSNEELSLKEAGSYAEALAMAKSKKRPIFLYFGAEWCGPCKKMKSTTLADIAVKDKLSKEYVICFIDTDRDKTTTKKYRVTGIPAYFIVSPEEKVLRNADGYKSKDEFISWLRPNEVSYIDP